MNRKPSHTGLLLMQGGRIHAETLEQATSNYVVKTPSAEHGYGIIPGSRFWNPKPIPTGWVTVHVEGDPEPVTTREPRGWGSELYARMTGGLYPRLWAGTTRPNEGFPSWVTWSLLAGSGAVVGMALYWAIQKWGAA